LFSRRLPVEGVFLYHAFDSREQFHRLDDHPDFQRDGGKPNPAAYRIARMLGQHVGEEQLRRRARIIQDLMRTAGPIAGILATALGSIYAGLKGILGT